MKKWIFFILITLSLVFATSQTIFADDDGGFENEGAEGFGEGLGTLSLIMLVLGAGYILFRRAYVLAKKIGLTEDKQYGQYIKEAYKQFRGPMMVSHLLTNIAATFFGLLHGLSFSQYTPLTFYSGWIAVISMTILSISGLIIYFKFRPFWKFRESRTFIRFLHRQWLFSAILIVSVLLHLAVAEDD